MKSRSSRSTQSSKSVHEDPANVLPVRDTDWAHAIIQAKANEHPYTCNVCGSKSVVLNAKTYSITCRMCRTTSRNVYDRRLKDTLLEAERLTPEDAAEMLRDMTSAFKTEHAKQRLDEAVKRAKGQLVELVLLHTPIALQIVGSVVTRFGFTDNLAGVIKAIRAIQGHVGDDIILLDGLEQLRVLFSPQNNFQAEEALEKEEEARVVEQALEQERERQAELKKLEEIAHERRRLALVRAKKAARGLNPNQSYEPIIRRQPPPHLVLLPGHGAFIRIVADFTSSFTWCLNGKPLSDDTPGYRGVHSSSLKIQYFTKTMCGLYTCRCVNDDGSLESTACVVSTVALKPRLVQRLTTPWIVYSLVLLRDQVLCLRTLQSLSFCSFSAPLRHLPPPPEPDHTLAMASSTSKVFTGSPEGVIKVTSVQIVTPSDETTSTESSKRKPAIPSAAPSAGAKPHAVVTTHAKFATSLPQVKCIAVVGQDKWLVASDMEHSLQFFALDKDGNVEKQLPTYTVTTTKRISLLATSPCLPHLGISYGSCVELFVLGPREFRKHELVVSHRRVTCMAFASIGSQLSVGDKGVQHGFLSLVNVETKRVNGRVPAHFGAIQFMRWVPRHMLLCTLGADHVMKLWDAAKHICIFSFHVTTPTPSDVLVTCNHAMECTILISSYAKKIEKWTVDALPSVLDSIQVENTSAVVMIQKQWRGFHARCQLN
ncbi:hypothetical protein Ae201684_003319 [Aphanomyces euteiches]|uniref:Protein C10 n=2 Tax=Aphanomyces euteiches TaxID=100861 RepID=A0A6G0XMN6_9STRA|nr:hypothetical protein Ae201684_003319 [Aphanomyces euteiches]KAH9157704.1 hypothetical protein AeRB84_000439 [Aphanomyces euteiches]